jgi:two-component system, OmpR family, phosphate regulon sensor histidine kinase PhoR
MGSVRRRLGAAFAVLMLLFVALVLVQLLVGDRLQALEQRHAERIQQALTANGAVLQSMTDAETGVRGFQLTGDPVFLDPYDRGRVGAFTALDRVADLTADPRVTAPASQERQAAAQWMYAYAIPIVNAGVADADGVRAAHGKELFDRLRAANAAVDTAIHAEQDSIMRADRRHARIEQLAFAALAVAFLAVALFLASLHQRQLLEPLEHIRLTLRRLAAGERSARATPAGPGEMRTVIGTLNDLAAETERLLDAEHARAVRNELRQAVASALRAAGDAGAAAPRITELIGTTLHAAAVHGRIGAEPGTGTATSWPSEAPPPSAATVAQILDGTPGEVVTVAGDPGAIAVPLQGDANGPAGLLYLVRRDDPMWSGDERRLLGALAREIEHAVHQQRLARNQARLISELRVLDERKDAFVATVTHELRTPLTSILGYVEMLGDGDGGELSPLQQRGVSAILRNALRLQETISDLLVLNRVDGPAGLAPAPIELSAALTGVYADLAPGAQAKEVSLTVEAQSAWVDGDLVQLQRAVRNLVENAVKFTPAGGAVTCRVTADASHAVLTVSDTGIGIPPDDLAGLFTPFHRAANAMHQAVQGSGLGLAIVRTIVTEHGGTVEARSRLNEGSTFTITLPGVPAPVDPARAPVPSLSQ